MSDVVAQIREAYEFYLLDSDRSAGEIFAQQVGQILDANQGKCPPPPPHTDSGGWSIYGRPE